MLADSGQKLIAIDDGEVAENSELCKANFVGRGNDEQGRLTTDKYTDLQAEKCSNEEDNVAGNWTLIAHKNSASSRIRSPTNRSNSPGHEKGETGNFQLCADPNLNLPTRNIFEPLSATGKEQSHAEVNCGTLDPITKQPLVLLNTSQHEVPSQTHEFSNSSPTREAVVSRPQDENNQDVQRPSQPTLSMLSIAAQNSTSAEMSKEQPISGSNLNHNAPIFVPKSSEKIPTPVATPIDSNQQHKGCGTTTVNKSGQQLMNSQGQQLAQGHLRQQELALSGTNFQKISTTDRVLLDALVSKSAIAKKNESGALALGLSPTNANAINLGKEFFDEDEEDNMLDICFDKVARDGDISPRQQRSGSNKSKRKTHGRQHSWDGKVTEEFVPRHLPMRLCL